MQASKSGRCPSCCPSGGAVFSLHYAGDDRWEWQCRNCGERIPVRSRRRPEPLPDQEHGLRSGLRICNPRQRRAIMRILREIQRRHGYRDEPRRHEFKQISIKVSNGGLFLVTNFGLVGDEGSLASLFCRDYRYFAIGTSGGIDLLNAKHGRPCGLFHSVNSLVR